MVVISRANFRNVVKLRRHKTKSALHIAMCFTPQQWRPGVTTQLHAARGVPFPAFVKSMRRLSLDTVLFFEREETLLFRRERCTLKWQLCLLDLTQSVLLRTSSWQVLYAREAIVSRELMKFKLHVRKQKQTKINTVNVNWPHSSIPKRCPTQAQKGREASG